VTEHSSCHPESTESLKWLLYFPKTLCTPGIKLCLPRVFMNTTQREETVFERKLCGNKITCYFTYPISTRFREKVLLFIFIIYLRIQRRITQWLKN
jgi:hypothetical protein